VIIGDILVVVSCSAKKIWDKEPWRGPTAAKEAYIGPLFKLARKYAERKGYDWIILSAKYGFIEPDYTISGNYNVTFNNPKTKPISLEILRKQVKEKKLYRYSRVIVLASKRYVEIVRKAFQGYNIRIEAPLEGLPIGKMLAKLKSMIEE